jgi:putative membrane protein
MTQMFTRNNISILILYLGAAMAPTALLAQVDSNQQPNPSQQPNPLRSEPDSTAVPGMSHEDMQDKIFLQKAAEGGTAEVQLGKLAVEKASGADVKAFGQKMVDDHTQMNHEMAPIAESKGVALPRKMTKADQAEYDKLATLTGEAFDKEYIAYMVKDHHADLREFRMAAFNTNDPELKAAVDKAARVIHEHMVMADKLAREKGIVTPGRGARPTGTAMN